MTALEIFVSQHQYLSYLIIFVGMLFEIDVFYVTGAIFTNEHHLNWILLVLVGFASLMFGDVLWYYLGRYSKKTRLGNWLNRRFLRYHNWLDANFVPRYAKLIFPMRFVAYLNRIMPFLAGWHSIEYRKFLKIHLLANLFWLSVMTTLGAVFGAIVSILGTRWLLKRVWLVIAALLVIFFAGEYLIKRTLEKIFEREKTS